MIDEEVSKDTSYNFLTAYSVTGPKASPLKKSDRHQEGTKLSSMMDGPVFQCCESLDIRAGKNLLTTTLGQIPRPQPPSLNCVPNDFDLEKEEVARPPTASSDTSPGHSAFTELHQ